MARKTFATTVEETLQDGFKKKCKEKLNKPLIADDIRIQKFELAYETLLSHSSLTK